ncbi:transposase [Aequorivita sp. Q41]|uniref:transposase n=1 Tax=Aequorivita sp. Q41 TaxID=3153300 RepID=UPI003242A2FC
MKFRIKSKIFLLDRSTVSLCLRFFDCAKYKTAIGAIKMHTLLDYDRNLPAYVNITNVKTADNKGVYDIPLLKRSVIVADRFYNDFSLLKVWDTNEVFFVVRHKENIQYITIKENGLPGNSPNIYISMRL